MLGNKKNRAASSLYWKAGVIRKVCLSPKVAETRSLVKVVDDTLCLSRQISLLMNTEIKTRMFTDSRPLLESIGSNSQVEEKSLRQSVAALKQHLKDAEVDRYSWIPGNEIVADVFTKQGSDRDSLEEIMSRNVFRHAQTEDNMVICEDHEINIKNLITKAQADERMRDLAVTSL